MIGLAIAIIVFNFIAFKTNKRLTGNQILHIWMFTIAFQHMFDVFIDLKYHAYWYFTENSDWRGVLTHTVLLPHANMIFLNWYPFKMPAIHKVRYLIFWMVAILLYEMITLLPEPWGYFHYGWWNLWYSVIIDPVLLLIALGYYKWVLKLENKLLIGKK